MADPLVRRIEVSVPPDRAFDVFCAHVDLWWPPGHRRFEGSRMTLAAEAGGHLTEIAPDGQHFVFGDVAEVDPPDRLVLHWHPGKLPAPTQVEIIFTATAAGTEVQVSHQPGPAVSGTDWRARLGLFEAAWDTVLPAFAAWIGTELHRGGY